ncbi:MAG: phenylacetate--CoA ligase family protein [Dehalococcoidia bacterium]
MMSEEMVNEFFDGLETMSPEQREKYQNQKVKEVVGNAYQNAPTVKELFDQVGVNPADITSVEDLEKVPIVRKTDLIEWQRSRPPYGGFLTVPPEEVERVFVTPGPVYGPHHTEEISWFGKTIYAAGFREGDMVINTATYHMSPAGILFHEGIRACGATAIPAGVGSTDAQIKTMLDLKVNGYVGMPSFLMTIIQRAEEMGHDFRRDFSLERAWFTGEMLPPSLRESLEGDYGIDTFQCYSVTETGGVNAYECSQKSGMHLMDEHIIEIVDHETGKQLVPGEVGEIVITPIHNKSWGLIRFGTGDMSSYITDPCPCGRTSSRLTGIAGRIGDAVKVRGMFVVAKQAEGVFNSFNEISKCQISVGREGQRDTTCLKVELKDEGIDRDNLAERLSRRFQEGCRVKADRIDFVERGAIPEEHKTIVDERTWD